MADLKPLVDYMLDQVRNRQDDDHIGNTIIVKLVYLVDVIHSRRHGERVTDLPWRYHHYGPYADELRSLIARKNLHFDRWVEAQFPKEFSASVRNTIDGVIDRWGLMGLNELLDYVYFETEPMEDAKRGDLLDFTKVVPEQQTVMVEKSFTDGFSPEWVSSMRRRLEEKTEASKSQKPSRIVYSDAYYAAQTFLGEEERGFSIPPGTELLGIDEY